MSTARPVNNCPAPNTEVTLTSTPSPARSSGRRPVSISTLPCRSSSRRQEPSSLRMNTVMWRRKRSGAAGGGGALRSATVRANSQRDPVTSPAALGRRPLMANASKKQSPPLVVELTTY